MSRYHGTEYFAEFDGNQSIDNGKMGRQLFKGGGGGSSTTQQRIDPILRPFITYGLNEAKDFTNQILHLIIHIKPILIQVNKHSLHCKLHKIEQRLVIH
jgi:hypothetical protein